MIVEVLFIGTELLMGQVLNTNAQYISKRLQALGATCYHQVTLGDNMQRLVEAYKQALSRADVIITTGGLGPTVDDITKKAAAKALGKPLVFREEAKVFLESYFQKLGRKIHENNYNQAYFTQDTTLLPNHHGTAPGGWVPAGEGKVIFHLPGPPKEMIPMFEESIAPFLQKNSNKVLVSKYIRIVGMGESEVDFLLHDLEIKENPSLSPYASVGEVVLRATALAKSSVEAQKLLNPLIEQVKAKLGSAIYRIDDDDTGSLQDTVITLAKEKGKTLAVAESLTAGMIAQRLTQVPGASQVFLGGMVTYSETIKEKWLQVPSEVLKKHTAVSEEVALLMARGIQKKSGAQVTIAVTGVAGPGEDEKGNPQGLVYIALCDGEKIQAKRFSFLGNRERVRELTTINSLNLLRLALIKNEKDKNEKDKKEGSKKPWQ